MQSFRHLLLRIVILSLVVNINAEDLEQELSFSCLALNLLNIVRCITPLVNASFSKINCLTDCVCIHGFSDATCVGDRCRCNNNSNLNDEDLARLRETQCESMIQKGLQVEFMKALCPDGSSGTCSDDCRCGHDAKGGGNCVDEGYTLNNKIFKLCTCDYDE